MTIGLASGFRKLFHIGYQISVKVILVIKVSIATYICRLSLWSEIW